MKIMRKNRIRLTESDLRRIVNKSVKIVLNEDLSHEDRLRKIVGQYASQIYDIIHDMTMYGPGQNNYLADLLSREKVGFIEKLEEAAFEMDQFAETEEDRAYYSGGFEPMGY